MTLHKPLLMQPATGDPDATYTGPEMRAMLSALYQFDGVIGAGLPSGGLPAGFAVAQRGAGANLSVDVAAGMASVTGDDIAGQNSYLCWSDATSNLVMPAAPGSGTRFHRVGLRIRDKAASGSWTTYEFLPDVVQDSGSGLPAEPASFLTLAQASIAAGQSSYQTAQLTDMRMFTPEVERRKNSGTTRTTTSLSLDPDLQVPWLAPSSWYEVTISATYVTSANGVKIAFTTPASAGGSYSCIGQGDQQGYAWATDQPTFGSGTSPWNQIFITGLIATTAAGGPFGLQWASNSGATSLTFQSGSYMKVRRTG